MMSALIIKGGNLLSTGYNKISGHPQAYFGCSHHAEFDAIRNAKADITGSKILVYRFSRKDNTLQNSKPCAMCQEEINKAGISCAIYVEDGRVIKESFGKTNRKMKHFMHLYVHNAMCYENGY